MNYMNIHLYSDFIIIINVVYLYYYLFIYIYSHFFHIHSHLFICIGNGGILIQNRYQAHLLCAIVFDCVDCVRHPKKYQKFTIRVNHTIGHNQKTKKWPH